MPDDKDTGFVVKNAEVVQQNSWSWKRHMPPLTATFGRDRENQLDMKVRHQCHSFQ